MTLVSSIIMTQYSSGHGRVHEKESGPALVGRKWTFLPRCDFGQDRTQRKPKAY